VLIRVAANSDIGCLASLVECYWKFEAIDGFERPHIESLLRTLLSSPELGGAWVAENDGRLCGYLTAVYLYSLEYGGLVAEIDELFVSAEKRSLGVGSLLMAAAEHAMAARGMARLQLQLGVDNHRGRRFYERHGFRRRAGFELLDKSLAN
jgi:GNAT superfamily N-acetyltransferase